MLLCQQTEQAQSSMHLEDKSRLVHTKQLQCRIQPLLISSSCS